MRKNIASVIGSFLAGEIRRGDTCSTDGTTLYSYALPIARKVGNKVHVRNHYGTRTTQSQINSVKVAIPEHVTVESL